MLVGNLPEKNTRKIEATTDMYVNENKLVKTLEKIEGAGRIEVFISYKNDGKKHVAQKISRTERGEELTPESVQDDFYVLSEESPEITGVLITATGASNPSVRERILRGAKHALGVPYHRISVELGK